MTGTGTIQQQTAAGNSTLRGVSLTLGIILYSVIPFTGFFSFALSVMFTDAPSTAERMERYLTGYWTVAAGLLLVSLIVSIVLWAKGRRPLVPLILSVVSFVAAGTPFPVMLLSIFVF